MPALNPIPRDPLTTQEVEDAMLLNLQATSGKRRPGLRRRFNRKGQTLAGTRQNSPGSIRGGSFDPAEGSGDGNFLVDPT